MNTAERDYNRQDELARARRQASVHDGEDGQQPVPASSLPKYADNYSTSLPKYADNYSKRDALNQSRRRDETENEKKSPDNLKREARAAAGYGKSAYDIAKNVEEGHEIRAFYDATKLAMEMRRDAKKGLIIVWIVALIFGILSDSLDPTWLVAFIVKFPLFIFLWGKGSWRVKVTVRIMMFFDFMPVVGLLPLSIIAVLYSWRRMHKKQKKAEKKLEELQEVYGEDIGKE